MGNKTKASDINIVFEFESKAEMTVPDAITLYRDNGIKRSELRQYILKTTALDIDQSDMKDTLPITSVTPTNKLTSNKPETEDETVVERAMQDLKTMVTMREELDRAEKRKKTDEIIKFIKELKE